MKLDEQTNICKLCFKDINSISLSSLIGNNTSICKECSAKFLLHISKFHLNTIPGISLFRYDETIRKCLYKLKGCQDIELAPIFLEQYAYDLHLRFASYYIVPMPSWREDDLKRGFNHVIEIFRCLNLPILPILYKKENIKQATLRKWQRTDMIDNIDIFAKRIIKNKKILLVDDVMTTGSTLSGAIKVIKKCNPKDIKILVLSKNEL